MAEPSSGTSALPPDSESTSISSPANSVEAGLWRKRILLFVVFSVLLGVFHQFATEKAARHNTGVTERGYDVVFDFDQQPYMNVGRKLRDTDWEWVTPRHRMPGYSILLSFLYDTDTAYEIDPTGEDQRRVSEGYFEKAKAFNILLSCAVLVVLYFFCRRWMPMLESFATTWAFGIFLAIFKAPYVQPEVIFYLTFTMAFFLLLQQLEAPSWKNGALSGVVLAFTFILKSAVIPLILLFLACYFLKLGFDFVIAKRNGKSLGVRALGIRLGQACLPLVIFCLLLSPYLKNTWALYGSPFWDVHSRHYLWMKTAEEKYKWRDLEISEPHFQAPPGEEAPNSKKYFRENGISEIIHRPRDGWAVLAPRVEKDYQALWFFLVEISALSVIVIALLHWREVLGAARRHWAAILMVLGFFLGYTFLYCWYMAIRVGPRLILGLALPLLFLNFWFISRFGGTTRIPRWGIRIHDGHIAKAVLLLSTAILGRQVLRTDLWNVEGGQ